MQRKFLVVPNPKVTQDFYIIASFADNEYIVTHRNKTPYNTVGHVTKGVKNLRTHPCSC